MGSRGNGMDALQLVSIINEQYYGKHNDYGKDIIMESTVQNYSVM